MHMQRFAGLEHTCKPVILTCASRRRRAPVHPLDGLQDERAGGEEGVRAQHHAGDLSSRMGRGARKGASVSGQRPVAEQGLGWVGRRTSQGGAPGAPTLVGAGAAAGQRLPCHGGEPPRHASSTHPHTATPGHRRQGGHARGPHLQRREHVSPEDLLDQRGGPPLGPRHPRQLHVRGAARGFAGSPQRAGTGTAQRGPAATSKGSGAPNPSRKPDLARQLGLAHFCLGQLHLAWKSAREHGGSGNSLAGARRVRSPRPLPC